MRQWQMTKLKAQIKARGSFDIQAFGLCLTFGLWNLDFKRKNAGR
jgi:hypothetical protein